METETATVTTDTFFNGRIRVRQRGTGYRFSIDAALLALHAEPGKGERVLDIGTGCGIIPLLLAHRHPEAGTITGVEVQPALAALAGRNVRENGMENRIRIVCQDAATLSGRSLGAPFDLAVTNPPYRKADSGRINPDTERAVARHELRIDLPILLDAVRRMVRTGGRVAVIYAAERTAELLCGMRERNLEPKILRPILSTARADAKLVLVEGRKAARPGLRITAPFVVYRDDGRYTDQARRALGECERDGGGPNALRT